jgi:AI-2 transport protein TqsA
MLRFLVGAAAFVIVVAGMRAATPILVPLLFALFAAILVASPLGWLRRRGLPPPLALAVVILGLGAFGLVAVVFVGRSMAEFLRDLPVYQERLHGLRGELGAWLRGHGIEVPEASEPEVFDPDKAVRLIRNLIQGLSAAFSNATLILILVIFLLLEASGFPAKLRALPGDSEATLARLQRVVADVHRYMAIKTWVSLLTGLMAWGWLLLFGVDSPLLWGLLTFLLNYIPNIGSVLAAIPPVLVALVQLGPAAAAWTALGYLLINAVIGYGLEPLWTGRGLGLSTLVVFLSLIFWGWVLGPVGMLLSVPLTMAVKIALESTPETRWIAVLLGSEVEAAAGILTGSAPEPGVPTDPGRGARPG